jgi:hypothetical protein
VNVSIRSAAIFTFTFVALSTRAVAQSDESGTLVMIARTNFGIVVAVDSAISTLDPKTHRPTVITDPSRKLIDLGKFGACTIDGFTGESDHGNILAFDARTWLTQHPSAKGADALIGILHVAKNSWDRERYFPDASGRYPGERRAGDPISDIMCGDLFNDGFGIIEAQTTVAHDGSAAVPTRVNRIGASFDLGGVLTYPILLGLIENKDAPSGFSRKLKPAYPAFRQGVLSDPKVVKSLQAFRNEQTRIERIYNPAAQTDTFPQSTLTQADVNTLFTAVYKNIERITKVVGPPNNVRLLSKCGRVNTTIEKTWPTCQL